MKIKQGTSVRCKKCNKLHNISPEEFDDPETSSDERNMGYEIQYIWEFEFICDKCNNELKISIEGYEYPSGILNYQEFNSEGCIIIENPSLEINNEEDHENDY